MTTLRLRVTHYRGKALAQSLVAEFSGATGTIGRHADCTLVLPDPARHVSRIQARVAIVRGGALIASANNTNPFVFEGRSVPRDESTHVGLGQSFLLAGYDFLIEPVADVPCPALPRPDQLPAFSDNRGAFIPEDAIGHLFEPTASKTPSVRDPFAPPPQSGAKPSNTAESLDPMARYRTPAEPVGAPSAADHGSELNAAFIPPMPETNTIGSGQTTGRKPDVAADRSDDATDQRPDANLAQCERRDRQLLDALLGGAGLHPSNPATSVFPLHLTLELMEHLGRLLRAATEPR